MANKPMSDEEVVAEMKKMVAFIKQEALEKAREIKVKADEDFSIEKAKIVRQETSNIDATYEKKKKQVEVQKRIARSNQTNKARLEQLRVREELLESVFETARKGLSDLTKDEGKYAEVLEKLTLQALYALMEKDIRVLVRSADSGIAKKAVDKAVSTYKSESGFECQYEIEEDLPKDSAGGVVVMGYGSRIKVNNSLDERLRLLEEKMLPHIREKMFGPNENRKHTT